MHGREVLKNDALVGKAVFLASKRFSILWLSFTAVRVLI